MINPGFCHIPTFQSQEGPRNGTNRDTLVQGTKGDTQVTGAQMNLGKKPLTETTEG